jgi:hypothetical protein
MMNSISLSIFGLLFAVTILGAANFSTSGQKTSLVENEEDIFRCPASVNEPKTIIGHSEVVYLGDDKTLMFDAKVDSGAKTSSIHAVNISTSIRKVKENNEVKELLYVRFLTMDDAGQRKEIEKMVSRVDQVRSASGVSTRYFFRETVWINDVSYEIEINLADRTALSKKMLIGKNLLEQGYLIDTTKSYVITRSINPIEKL